MEAEGTRPEALDERIGRLEQLVGELRGQVERLDNMVTSMRPAAHGLPQSAIAPTAGEVEASARVAPPTMAPVPSAPLAQAGTLPQVLCPHCRGGNPPSNISCMWCGRSLQMVAGPRGPIPLPPAIAATASASTIPSPPVTSTPTGYANAPAAIGSTGANAPARQQPDILKSGEFWLSRVGIVLFLLGIGFLFKYSVDKGWLTEWVRVGIGFAVGAALLVIGSMMGTHRRALKYVLLGGSIATFYITGFAAYQLFHLVAYELAFAFMAAVTVLAFVLALGHNQSLLSLVGVAGGLATPFLLGDRSGGVVGLVAYTCVVAAGGVAVYFFRGWRSLLWTTFSGTWLALVVGLAGTRTGVSDFSQEMWALQAGAVFCLLTFWALPVVRETLHASHPERWALPSLDYIRDSTARRLFEDHAHVLVVLAPLVSLGFSRLVWTNYPVDTELGAATLGVAVLFGAAAWGLRQSQTRLAYTHAVMSVLLLTLALVQLVHGNVLMVALAIEVAALHFVAHRQSDRGTAIMGHILWGLLALWVGTQLALDAVVTLFMSRRDEIPLLNPQALTYLGVIGLTLAASFVVRPRGAAVLYRAAVHLGVLGLLWRELVKLPDGIGYVALAWAAYATALQIAAWRAPARVKPLETGVPAHLVFAMVAFVLAFRLLSGRAGEMVFFNLRNLIDLAVILLAVGVSFLPMERPLQLVYRGGAHLAVLAMLWRELAGLQNGNAYVTIAWGVWACALLYAGIRLDRHAPLLYAGAGTLVLLVAKLFLVDLAELEAIWRVLIFLGIGGLFLVLSYYFQNVMKRTPRLGEDTEGR